MARLPSSGRYAAFLSLSPQHSEAVKKLKGTPRSGVQKNSPGQAKRSPGLAIDKMESPEGRQKVF